MRARVATVVGVLALLLWAAPACQKDAPSASGEGGAEGGAPAAESGGGEAAGEKAPGGEATPGEGEAGPGEAGGEAAPAGDEAGEGDEGAPKKARAIKEVLEMGAVEFPELKDKAARYASVNITYDHTKLSDQQKEMLEHLLNAATVLDGLFWDQASADGRALFEKLREPTNEYEKLLKRYVRINYGRFDRLDGYQPFIGETPSPLGANYYPADMTKEELEKHLQENPDDAEAFTDEFTVIRRDDDGNLKAIPYSEFYGERLKVAADELRKAAALTENASLKKFLESRAAAFLSNDYYQSDVDWMDLEGNLIGVTIGPYEVYEDRLFNYKAAFEAFITLNDPEAAAKLTAVAEKLPEMEDNLPIPDEHKNRARGSESPIRVADVIYTAGDTRAGVQTLAFNLPNDERVREAKGSKKVLLRNVSNAKFEKILEPIAKLVVTEEQLPFLKEEAYFNHTLMHEMSHGIGPGNIKLPDGTETTVGRQLKELYSTIEEAKADILGIYNTFFLIDLGVFPKSLEKEAAVTTMAGTFRSVRFGAEEAHGKANMIVFNSLLKAGAYTHDPETGRFAVDFTKIRDAAKELAQRILMAQAKGDYEAAKAIIDDLGEMPESMKAAIERLDAVPVDIEPIYMVEPH